jgi:hypothetical protein
MCVGGECICVRTTHHCPCAQGKSVVCVRACVCVYVCVCESMSMYACVRECVCAHTTHHCPCAQGKSVVCVRVCVRVSVSMRV